MAVPNRRIRDRDQAHETGRKGMVSGNGKEAQALVTAYGCGRGEPSRGRGRKALQRHGEPARLTDDIRATGWSIPQRDGETGRTPRSEAGCKRPAGRTRRSCRRWRNTGAARSRERTVPGGGGKPPHPQPAAGGNGSRERMHNRRRGNWRGNPQERTKAGRQGDLQADFRESRLAQARTSRRGRTRFL